MENLIDRETTLRLYRESHPHADDAELERAGVAAEEAATGNVTAKLALSVALFDESQDWPEANRRAALGTYRLTKLEPLDGGMR